MAERDIVAKIRNYLKTVPHCFFWKLKFESKIAVLGGFKPRTAIFLYVLYRPSFKFVKKFFHPWLEL